jgi:hypothetical protein
MFARSFSKSALEGNVAKRFCVRVQLGRHYNEISPPHHPNRLYSSTRVPCYHHDGANSSNPSHNDNIDSVARISTHGSRAFVDCELFALVDLFDKYALPLDTVASNNTKFINHDGLRRLMHAVGESPTEEMLQKLFEAADADNNGVIDIDVSGIDKTEKKTL